MELTPLEASDIALVAEWLGKEENYRWLDFGGGVQILAAPALAVMAKRDKHNLRLYRPDEAQQPIGIVGLSNISMEFRSATLWYVLGDKTLGDRGYTSRAAWEMVREGFETLGLHSINAWTVESNVASVRILERIGFRRLGELRECHLLDGRLVDRLLFDVLASEFGVYEPSDGVRRKHA